MTDKLTQLPIDSIYPNPYQPRLEFSKDELTDLAKSIAENGLIQPIIVRPSDVVGYELIAGERRLRASRLAGLDSIPAIIKPISNEESMKQAIIENLQRSDLNPIEEAKAYQQLIDKLEMTHDDIAKSMGKSRPYISNSLRLLTLGDRIKQELSKGQISPGHARLLIPLDKNDQEKWLDTILQQALTVRQLEKALKSENRETSSPKINKDVFIKEQEQLLKQKLGQEVQIKMSSAQKGHLTISFNSLEEFHNLIHNFD